MKKLFAMLLVVSCSLQAGGAPPTPTINKHTIKNIQQSFIAGTATTGLIFATKILCYTCQNHTFICNSLPEGSAIIPFASGIGITAGCLCLYLKECK